MHNSPVQRTIDKKIQVVSLKVNVCTESAIIDRIADLAKAGNGGYACFSTVHMVMEAYDDPSFAEIVNLADLVVPDGMPLVWMQRLYGQRDAKRCRGTTTMLALLRHAEKTGLSVGFYGGSPEVIESILDRAEAEFPELRIVYSYSPPFRSITEEEDEAIVAEINAALPDLLFVGLGCPKQEKWCGAHAEKAGSVMLAVGAAFDFYAGNVRECPEWMSRVGLEWLYRLWQEPRRLWYRYLVLNPRFLALAAMQLLKLRKFS